jgi:soluble lytic murein transglycosylase-like protein
MGIIKQIIVGGAALALLVPGAALAEQRPDPELREKLRVAASSADSFEDRFDYEATRADLAPELVLAVIEVESNFDRYAISVAGALGLMQVMPFWRDEIGRPGDNLNHIDTNLRYGCTILKHYLDKEKGDLRRALGRYNGSLGKRKYPNKVIDKLTGKWFQS